VADFIGVKLDAAMSPIETDHLACQIARRALPPHLRAKKQVVLFRNRLSSRISPDARTDERRRCLL